MDTYRDKGTEQHTEKAGRKPEGFFQPPIMSQVEKEARIYEAAKRLGVKIGGAK
jgi:hypothetical protein